MAEKQKRQPLVVLSAEEQIASRAELVEEIKSHIVQQLNEHGVADINEGAASVIPVLSSTAEVQSYYAFYPIALRQLAPELIAAGYEVNPQFTRVTISAAAIEGAISG